MSNNSLVSIVCLIYQWLSPDFTEIHNFEFGAMIGKKSHRLSKTNNQLSLPLLGHAADKPNKMPSLGMLFSYACKID